MTDKGHEKPMENYMNRINVVLTSLYGSNYRDVGRNVMPISYKIDWKYPFWETYSTEWSETFSKSVKVR